MEISSQFKCKAVRKEFLPFARPCIGEAELREVEKVLRSGWLTTGPRTHRFEEHFAEYVGARYAIAVNSATAALHLALEALGVQAGDEVITTTFTFAATAEVIRYLDAKPVLVDIDPVTLNIDVNQIREVITPKTKAIIPVHVAGQSADLNEIHNIAKQNGLAVVEDAAHALSTWYKGRLIGGISDLTAFSFYCTKPLSTGEGGMITTNDERLADRCRIMSLHGISKDAWKRYTSEGSWYYEIIAPGFKYNMTDIAAALGLVQLDKLEAMTCRRLEIAASYNMAFREHPSLEIPKCAPYTTHCYHLYIIRLNLDQLTIDRNTFINYLRDANIGVSVHWIPLHIHPYYREMYGYKPEDFPVASQQYERIISLPIYPTMSDTDVNDVISAVKQIADTFAK